MQERVSAWLSAASESREILLLMAQLAPPSAPTSTNTTSTTSITRRTVQRLTQSILLRLLQFSTGLLGTSAGETVTSDAALTPQQRVEVLTMSATAGHDWLQASLQEDEEEYAYACGAGESIFQQAAEEQMYAIAMNNFAKRINSEVNSETKLEFNDNNGSESRKTKTVISYVVKNTTIREHIAKETGTFKYQNKQFTFVKLRMNKQIFDALVAEAKNAKVIAQNNN